MAAKSAWLAAQVGLESATDFGSGLMNTFTLAAGWAQTSWLAELARNLLLIIRRDDLLPVSVIVLGSAVILAILARRRHSHIRTALVMYAAGLVIILLSAAPTVLDWTSAARSLHAAGILLIGFAIVKLGSILLFDVLLSFAPIAPPQVLRDLLVAAGYLAVGLWQLARNGVTLSGIVATSAVMTGIIVFALQDSLANILGGLVLQIDRSFAEGDWVKIDQSAGRVTEITWRHVAIETRNWDTVIIPNSQLMKSEVVVLGRRSGEPLQERRWIYFNVDFRVPPTNVISAVTQALVNEPVEGCAAEPAPNCVLMDFTESYCRYAARYWLTDLVKDDPTDSSVRCRIYFALQRAGIPLSVPALTTFLETRDQERVKLHHELDIAQRLSAFDLAHVELFQSMNDEELHKLAERLRFAPFMKGELITRQGAEAHWLYILTKGSGEVVVSTDTGLRKTVAKVHAGDFFGEMSMLTGEPRSASLKALEDTECYRLDRRAFDDILKQRPEIAQHLSELLARRKVEIEAVRHDLDAEAKARLLQHQQRSIFDSIHRLFDLKPEP